jgi:hypothetical protein
MNKKLVMIYHYKQNLFTNDHSKMDRWETDGIELDLRHSHDSDSEEKLIISSDLNYEHTGSHIDYLFHLKHLKRGIVNRYLNKHNEQSIYPKEILIDVHERGIEPLVLKSSGKNKYYNVYFLNSKMEDIISLAQNHKIDTTRFILNISEYECIANNLISYLNTKYVYVKNYTNNLNNFKEIILPKLYRLIKLYDIIPIIKSPDCQPNYEYNELIKFRSILDNSDLECYSIMTNNHDFWETNIEYDINGDILYLDK